MTWPHCFSNGATSVLLSRRYACIPSVSLYGMQVYIYTYRWPYLHYIVLISIYLFNSFWPEDYMRYWFSLYFSINISFTILQMLKGIDFIFRHILFFILWHGIEQFHNLEISNFVLKVLTHLGLSKMAAVLKQTFSNIFSLKKMFVFGFEFHWSLFQRVPIVNKSALVEVIPGVL